MRIIAGERRGMRLVTASGQQIRPTSDKVREAMFAILGERVVNQDILDLFCGSGAVALEALSRGARCATLVDRSPRAMDASRRNAETTGFQSLVRLVQKAWQPALDLLGREESRFGGVFLDPPYDTPYLGQILASASFRSVCLPRAFIVVEHRTGDAPSIGEAWRITKTARYGDTSLIFLEANDDARNLPRDL